MATPPAVHIVGASGRSGAALCRALLDDGAAFVPVVRNAGRWDATRLPGAPVIAELGDPASLQAALGRARRVVSCAHARFAPAILDAAGQAECFVFLGSTRKFTRWPDAHGDGVQAGETAFLASGRAGVMLHPTMVYGAEGEDNVQRLASLLRRLPFVPLPDAGRSLVQPIHQSDVTRAIRAALAIAWDGPHALVIAGPEPISYAAFARAVARAAGLRPPRIVWVPAGLILAAAPLTSVIPGVPRIRRAELRRLMEDKAFGIADMRAILHVSPLSLHDGLALTFRAHP